MLGMRMWIVTLVETIEPLLPLSINNNKQSLNRLPIQGNNRADLIINLVTD